MDFKAEKKDASFFPPSPMISVAELCIFDDDDADFRILTEGFREFFLDERKEDITALAFSLLLEFWRLVKDRVSVRLSGDEDVDELVIGGIMRGRMLIDGEDDAKLLLPLLLFLFLSS